MFKKSCEDPSFIFKDDCRFGGGEETLLKSEKYVKCIFDVMTNPIKKLSALRDNK